MATLSDTKKALLERMREQALRHSGARLLREDPNPGVPPLSFAQQRLWLIHQLVPESFLYNVPRAVQITGKLHVAALQRSLNEIARRHETLRTTFSAEGGEPHPKLSPQAEVPLVFADLDAAVDCDRLLNTLGKEEYQRPFDLANGPLIRASLWKIDAESHLLLIVMHHIISDGWTGGIVFEELGALYGAFSSGRPSPLPELSLQYSDYARWQRKKMQGQFLAEELAYWRRQLTGAPALLELPTDYPRPQNADSGGAVRWVVLPKALSSDVKTFCQRHRITIFTGMLAALKTVLLRWTDKSDLVVGTISANRNRTEVEKLIGCFVNFLPLRTTCSDDDSVLTLLTKVSRTVLGAFEHQECPFEKVVETLNPARALNANPLYNVALLVQNFPEMAFRTESLEARFVPFDTEAAFLDLRFLVTEAAGDIRIDCEYNTQLFDGATIDLLLTAYRGVLAQFVEATAETRLADMRIPEALHAQAEARREPLEEIFAVAATFTSEPIAEPLNFWLKQMDLKAKVEFAPYNQVFQQLLHPQSLLAANSQGANIILLRTEDWQTAGSSDPDRFQELERVAAEFSAALHTAVSHSAIPFLLCFCPPSTLALELPGQREQIERLEEQLAADVDDLPQVHVITSAQVLAWYPVRDYEDVYASQIGHIPYTRGFFAALGTTIARRISALRRAPRKVIALDCDNTLWAGVCGEDGPGGVIVDAPRRTLQAFMLAQHDAGMLLCLTSKNSEEDVAAVFAENPGMQLRQDHITASRIDWCSKADNLKELASDLNLGLDSFIFMDDNPLECAEVRSQCPEVLTLELPADPARIPAYLDHVWAFDRRKATREDSKRGDYYRQEAQRSKYRSQSISLKEFLDGLELEVTIRCASPEDLGRLSQLTERTNQFNLTTVRRSEGEISALMQSGTACLAVDVRDRFGDYGLVGMLIFARSGTTLVVDTFLLSCRVLGRRVEHRMLAHLIQFAAAEALEGVDIRFVATAKNQPGREFLESLRFARKTVKDSGTIYRFETSGLTSRQDSAFEDFAVDGTLVKATVAKPSAAPQRLAESETTAQVALHLSSVDAILYALESQKVAANRLTMGDAPPPRTLLEEILSGIWASVLHIDQPGIHDNFFRLGGHSLVATQVVARIRQSLGAELPLRALFEAPTIAQLAERVAAARRVSGGFSLPPLFSSDHAGSCSLSFAQQRLWFLDQLEPGAVAYNIPQMIRIRGPLKIGILERGINEIVKRHEALRTTFRFVNAEPVQVIAPHLELRISITKVSSASNGEQPSAMDRISREEWSRPFDLLNGPLLRVRLLAFANDDYALLICMHHIVSDRWSMGLFAGELTALYSAFSRDQPSPLPALPVQYADYALWQRAWLKGAMLDEQIGYWKRKLSGAPAVLEIPTDHPRPAVQTYRGGMVERLLPGELVAKLGALGQAEGSTLFMTLLAAFQILLGRYAEQDDVVVGTPIAGRSHTQTESLIGFFVNTLALRTDLSGDITFRDLLARVRQAALEAYDHQDVPFEKLVEELEPERSLSYNPIFQVLFALQNARVETVKLLDLEVERVAVKSESSAFDLSWFAIETPAGLLLRAEYRADLFEAGTIERMLGQYEALLEAAAAHPETLLSKLSLLTAGEKSRLLVTFNDTARDYPRNLCIHDFVSRQAGLTPDATALVDGERRITYREINAHANQIAHFLIRQGAGPDVLIGIYAQRTPDMVAGILGILKSGGAYVPLDPNYPKERLGYILEDAKPMLVLTQEALAGELSGLAERLICLDRDWAEIAREPQDDPVTAVRPNHLAYVLFTSGSTGRPKGVAIEHRSTALFIQWCNEALTPEQLAGVLFCTSICFDMSTFEMFVTLSAGGKIILAENPLELPVLQARNEVTLINTVPSAIAELVRMRALGPLVKTLFLAGEALPDPLVEAIYNSTAVEDVFNLYGPTENGYSTFARVERGQAVTIGRPLANCQAYILDKHGNIAPIGVPGELYLAGDGLARGYYGRSDLTEERFVPNPFHSGRDARMYRTSDLCRWLPDGDIQYLGRMDHQIKLRGFRIELGEIESALDRHPSVRQSVVVVREDEPGMQRLVAYVALDPTQSVAGEELRQYVAGRLAEFMVPSAVIALEAFPLTPNGKVNRKALPAPAYPAPSNGDGPELLSPVEELIARIWSDVLHRPHVSRTDNFFSLGGHSLLATQVISRIRETLGIELPLRALFEAPVLAKMAEVIERHQRDWRGRELPLLERANRDQVLPLSFAQHRLWFLDQLEPDNPFYNIPSSLRARFEIDADALEGALNSLVQRHESLRTTFFAVDGQPQQVIAPKLEIHVDVRDFGSIPEPERDREVNQYVSEEARRPFDLARGPLLRAAVVRIRPSENILLLNIHHIVSDRWSMNLLIRELASLYEARREGRAACLPELPVQYADFAVWQRSTGSGKLFEEQLGYWTKQLAGAPPVSEFPTDYPRQRAETFRGDAVSMTLSGDLKSKLNALSQQESATLFMTLLAGFQAVLSRCSGQEDVVVGAPIASRNHPHLERLIGFFANTLALRLDLSGDPSFSQLLARVRETSLEAYAHQDVPFEKVVEQLDPERSLSHNPIVQIFFVLQNAPQEGLGFAGFDLEHLETETKTAKGDLFLSVSEFEGGIRGRIEYNTDLYERETIERLWRHYEQLLQGAVENPSRRLSELPLLDAGERELLLEGWNETVSEYRRDLCVHRWFEEQAARTPEAIACVFENDRLTYRELNERANQLAHALNRLGAGVGQRIAIYVERSLTMLVGLLGIQKSGAAYVPIDPAYPAERIRLILEEARAAAIVTEQHLSVSLPEADETALPRVYLDSGWEAFASESRENPDGSVRPEDSVYIIFTSGSTGRPKGVEVPHGAVVNLLASMARELAMGPADVFPALASFAFDMCIPELYLALVTGGCVALGRERLAADGAELAAFLRHVGATIVHATPTSWRLLLEAGFTGRGLKRAIGAEALPPELCIRLLEAEPSLYNFYGPTETTVWSTMHHFRSAAEPVAIGRPLANTRIYLLDRHRQPVPIGVEGELYIAGDGVALGYLHRPELTAERFVTDPFQLDAKQAATQRMYRTGDRARYHSDGRIEYLGRSDFQVKLRGYRIELGEIEAVLAQHPAVRQAVAAIREDTPGDQRLVGYIVPEAGADASLTASEAELRAWVKARLPEYMTPVRVVNVESFRLTPNGKVDRKQLPAVEYQRGEEQSFEAPRTPTEEVITGIWCEVLKLERVGAADEFFQLGGHSLLATQVVSRIREAFQVELPLRALFEAPTVRGLAQRVEALGQRHSGLKRPPLTRAPRPERLPLSFAQQRLWFLDQLEPGNALYNVPFLVRLTGPLNATVLGRSLDEIVRRHEALRTRFVMLDDEPAQVIDPCLLIPAAFTDLTQWPVEDRLAEARRRVLQEIQRPFDLQGGPLLRASLIQLNPEDHILVLNTHHIVSDRWSLGVLADELAALYEAYLRGQPSPLPELPVQYADYALWQRQYLLGGALDRQLAFWKQHLAGAPTLLNLASGGERQREETFWGGAYTQGLDPDLVDGLRLLSTKHRVTLFMTLLAGFNVLLGYHSHQDDLVIGTDLANRTDVSVEKLIGFFVNLLPIRTRLPGELPFAQLLSRTRETSLGAYANQDVPFDKLVEELKPERIAGRHPLVQALFVMQNTPRSAQEFGGLKCGPVGVTSRSRFDLVLFINNPDQNPFTTWMYNPAIFDQAGIAALAELYNVILRTVTVDPEITLSALYAVLETAKLQDRAARQKQFQAASRQGLAAIRRRPRTNVPVVS